MPKFKEGDLAVVNTLVDTPVYIIANIIEMNYENETRGLTTCFHVHLAELKYLRRGLISSGGKIDIGCLKKPSNEQLTFNFKNEMVWKLQADAVKLLV